MTLAEAERLLLALPDVHELAPAVRALIEDRDFHRDRAANLEHARDRLILAASSRRTAGRLPTGSGV